jgi:NAD(P)-dependent dehydrogenase (short-subunit alcohol dehydrogenase family)
MAEGHFLVFGGTRGIGRVLVEHLSAGAADRISVFGRSAAAHASSAASAAQVAHYEVDVTHAGDFQTRLTEAVARFGKVTCAVFLQRHRGGPEDFEVDLAVALTGTRNAIDHLVREGSFAERSSIVLVSSVADHYVAPEQSLGYHVAKAGFAHLARYYALALGASGIRVNTVSPCVVAKDEAKAFYDKNAWLVERFEKYIPLARMGKPQDIVNAIMFLAGEQASYITGQNIVVDGGLTLRSHESVIRDFPRGA